MRKSWQNVNVDLDFLVSSIQKFFSDRGFLITVDGSGSKFVIRAEVSEVYDVDGGVVVSVEGNSSNLVVSFDFEREKSKNEFFGPLTMSFFGMGVLFIRRMKIDEDRFRLEREFWRFIDDVLSAFPRLH